MGLPSRCVVLALATLVIGGCSHGTVNDVPAAPTAPTPLLRLLTITPVGGGTMTVGDSVPITSEGPPGGALGAFAQWSDGSVQYVKAAWTSSDANVVSVEGNAIVAKGRGTATLTATFEGVKANETFTVEPTMEGNWSGTYIVDSCDAGSGSMAEVVCSAPSPGRAGGAWPVGGVAPIALRITKVNQNGITASATFGDYRGTLTGTDRGSNYLTLSGDLTSTSGARLTVTYWDARVHIDSMEGFIGFEVRVPGLPSYGAVAAHLADVTRH